MLVCSVSFPALDGSCMTSWVSLMGLEVPAIMHRSSSQPCARVRTLVVGKTRTLSNIWLLLVAGHDLCWPLVREALLQHRCAALRIQDFVELGAITAPAFSTRSGTISFTSEQHAACDAV